LEAKGVFAGFQEKKEVFMDYSLFIAVYHAILYELTVMVYS
jgi:hypothetical protein